MQTPQNKNKYISDQHFNFKQQKLHAHIHITQNDLQKYG